MQGQNPQTSSPYRRRRPLSCHRNGWGCVCFSRGPQSAARRHRSHMRYFEITRYHVKPGHTKDWNICLIRNGRQLQSQTCTGTTSKLAMVPQAGTITSPHVNIGRLTNPVSAVGFRGGLYHPQAAAQLCQSGTGSCYSAFTPKPLAGRNPELRKPTAFEPPFRLQSRL